MLDLNLPEIVNLDGLGHVLDAFEGAPVIAMAIGDGKSPRRMLLEAKQRGASYLLRKPFNQYDMIETVKDAAALKAGNTRTHVMLMEDSATVLKITTKMLSNAGYRVSGYPSMEDAINAMVLLDVDVVVTDIFMPGIGGLEGVARIRKAWPNIGVVAMSSGLDGRAECSEVLRAAQKSGAMQTLSKPFTPDQLLRKVREVIPKISTQKYRKKIPLELRS